MDNSSVDSSQVKSCAEVYHHYPIRLVVHTRRNESSVRVGSFQSLCNCLLRIICTKLIHWTHYWMAVFFGITVQYVFQFRFALNLVLEGLSWNLLNGMNVQYYPDCVCNSVQTKHCRNWGSHSGDCEECCLLECNAVKSSKTLLMEHTIYFFREEG